MELGGRLSNPDFLARIDQLIEGLKTTPDPSEDAPTDCRLCSSLTPAAAVSRFGSSAVLSACVAWVGAVRLSGLHLPNQGCDHVIVLGSIKLTCDLNSRSIGFSAAMAQKFDLAILGAAGHLIDHGND